MTQPRKKKLLAEAVHIFLRLQDNPDDVAAKKERDAFCARGDEENAAYAELEATWKTTGIMGLRSKLLPVLVLCVFGLAAWSVADPLRIRWSSDLRTGAEPVAEMLASGDAVTLDGGSALIDDTDGAQRRVELLEGAALFDVEPTGAPFEVRIGELTVEVIGTTFEAGFLEDGYQIAVEHGDVRVRLQAQTWRLEAGDKLVWSNDAEASVTRLAPEDVAAWRSDVLIADGLSLAQAAAVIDRRLPGRIVIVGQDLAAARATGSLSLTEPLTALRTLALTRDARVISTGFLTIIIP